ncbi:unnamed protein product [Cuscuta epithymum]|nr:unnamed protein product [Cuscuta epithymum]
MQYTVVWFKLDIPDIEVAEIPECMRRHLFEHTSQYARLLYGATSWTVKVDNYCFTDGFVELFIENDIEYGSYALLRHVGNFTFEVYMFDKQGYSLNLAGTPVGCSNPLHTPDDFLVYVESSFEDYSYGILYDPPSFLYVPKKTSKEWCEGFLRSCSGLRKCLRIYYGKDDACFTTGEQPFLQKIQMTFELKRSSTLFFVKHGCGGALLLVISKCGIEELPKETNAYEIRTAATGDSAALLQ